MNQIMIILAFVSLFSCQKAFAQRITRLYNNVSFSAALKDLNARQDKYSINFVYDELEDFKVTKSTRNQSVPDAILQLIGFYPIKMKVIDHVIIVECMQKSASKMIGRIVDEHHCPVDLANESYPNFDTRDYQKGMFDETCMEVVPLSFHIIAKASSFEDAIRLAISHGGDSDTIGAIVGSIAEARFGIPEVIKEKAMSYLPDDMKAVYQQFEERVAG